MTKIHVWSLTQYDQVIFYDSDFVFLQNPIAAIAECAKATVSLPTESSAKGGDLISKIVQRVPAPFCAAVDQGIGDSYGDSYFNSGFMVITPNLTTFDDIVAHRAWADNTGHISFKLTRVDTSFDTPLTDSIIHLIILIKYPLIQPLT